MICILIPKNMAKRHAKPMQHSDGFTNEKKKLWKKNFIKTNIIK